MLEKVAISSRISFWLTIRQSAALFNKNRTLEIFKTIFPSIRDKVIGRKMLSYLICFPSFKFGKPCEYKFSYGSSPNHPPTPSFSSILEFSKINNCIWLDKIHTKTEKYLVCRHHRWELYERFTSSTRQRRRGLVKEVFYYVSYIHVFRLTCLFFSWGWRMALLYDLRVVLSFRLVKNNPVSFLLTRTMLGK